MNKEDLKTSAWFMIALVIALLMCFAGLFSSCATSKNTDTQKQIDYSGDLQLLQSSIESLRTDFSKQTKITTDKLSNLQFENKTTDYSPPDSTGRQYPTRVSETLANKQEQERQQIDETVILTMQQFSNRLDSLGYKFDVLLKQKAKVIELSWWDLHKDNVYCAVIALLIVGWLVFKKRKR